MDLPVNQFKRAIKSGKAQLGLWCSFPTYQTVELLAGSGFDWLLLDMEHSPNDIGSLNTQVIATKGGTASPIVRVQWNDMVMIKRVLDIGVQTILVPYVQTAEEATTSGRLHTLPARWAAWCRQLDAGGGLRQDQGLPQQGK